MSLAIVLAAAVWVCAPGWALVTADPNDAVYRDLDRWQQQGYLEPLPSLRPYPTQLIVSALNEVAAKAGPVDAELARSYLDALRGGLLGIPVHASATYLREQKQADGLNRLGLQADGSGTIGDLVGFSVRGRLVADDSTAEVFPRWADDYEATLATQTPNTGTRSSLPISFGGQPFAGYGVLNGLVSFGTDRLWIQGGLVQSSFGPVLESPILGPQAPQAGHFSATYRGSWFTYTNLVEELVAYYAVDASGNTSLITSSSGSPYPQKYLFLQTFNLSPWPWVQADIVQAVVSGGRFSPTYLLPLLPLYTQAYLGDWDNSFAGGYFQFNLPFGIRPSLLLYVDDLDLKKLLQLNFNTDGNKVAIQAGLSWAPPLSVPVQASLTYTAITPYTYTHFSYDTLNYLQYTNLGQQLGSILPPNSDQWTLRVEVIPLSWLRLDLWGKLIRHGNGSDYGSGVVVGTGTVYDDGALTGPITFLNQNSFLTQAVLEKDEQIGIEGTADLAYIGLRGELSLSYTLEGVQNRDLNPAAPNELNNILGIRLSFGF
ncbi:MAG TPA: hypothetical protein VFH83_10160 [Spirochaetia bacterium]|nr:hypothetical protein [Spirochaetia bacterium]